MRDSRSRFGALPAGNVPAEPNGIWGRGRDRDRCSEGMPERRWRVLGRGRGLFAIEVDDGGGFRAATTAEVDAALRQRGLFGAAEYTVRHVGSADDDRDDVDVG